MYWFDGHLSERSIVLFDLTDRGLTLGDALFDTSFVRNGRVFLAEAHLARLATSAAALSIDIDGEVAAQALYALAGAIGDGAVRLTLTRGGGARGLRLPAQQHPCLFGAAAPDRAEAIFAPIRLAMTPILRNETSLSSQHKTVAYLDAVIATRAAEAAGADEALFENTKGQIACTATANIFAIFGDRLSTPPLVGGALAGTMRAFVLARAEACGLRPQESAFTRVDLQQADALFVTNSLRLLAPCQAVDGKTFASAENDRVKKLQETIHAAVVTTCGRL